MCEDCLQWDEDEEETVEAEGCTCTCTGDSLETEPDGKVICKDCHHEVRSEED
jgi:hypothetical protein